MLIRIATRTSPLALKQSEEVAKSLQVAHATLDTEILPLITSGDRQGDKNVLPGKEIWVKELELALLEGRADLAVHSLKDVPVSEVQGLYIGAITARLDPRDLLITAPPEVDKSSDYADDHQHKTLATLPEHARIGTSSLRRRSQLLGYRKDFNVVPLHGNVGTRLKRLKNGDFDAIVLASAGLQRLGLELPTATPLSLEECLPAVGQGALALQIRKDDAITPYIKKLHHQATAQCVNVERQVAAALNADCQTPFAAHAYYDKQDNNRMHLKALWANHDNDEFITAYAQGHRQDAQKLGNSVIKQLTDQGLSPL